LLVILDDYLPAARIVKPFLSAKTPFFGVSAMFGTEFFGHR